MAAAALGLQGALGNRLTGRLLAGALVQPKLTVDRPGDRYEQEADRVADQVMRMSEPPSRDAPAAVRGTGAETVQRVCSECQEDLQRQPAEEEEEERLQAEEASAPLPPLTPSLETAVQGARQDSGKPLDPATLAFMEPRFGHDLGHVRVHTGPRAAAAAQTVSAKAFTTGRDIVFGQGQYTPATATGQRLLAHELTHTIQQTTQVAQSNAPMSLQRTPLERDDRRARRRERWKQRRARRRARRAVRFVGAEPIEITSQDTIEQDEKLEDTGIPPCPTSRQSGGGKQVNVIAGGYPSHPDAEDEIQDVQDGSWLPGTADFLATADSDPGNLMKASNFGEFLGALLASKDPVQRLVFVGHGYADAIWFGPDAHISEAVLDRQLNEEKAEAGQEYYPLDPIREKFADGATFDIYACNVGTDRSLMEAIANWFCVCVRAFQGPVEWCLQWNDRNEITSRGRIAPAAADKDSDDCNGAGWQTGFGQTPPVEVCPQRDERSQE